MVATADGDAAVLALSGERLDLLVLDELSPDSDTLRLLREIRLHSDVPVILLTPSGNETAEVQGLELGADACVVKPLSPLALLARAKALLRRADRGNKPCGEPSSLCTNCDLPLKPGLKFCPACWALATEVSFQPLEPGSFPLPSVYAKPEADEG